MTTERITISETKAGRVARVKLRPGESVLVLREGAFYRLGGQMEDVVPAHAMTESNPVAWCHIQQEWVDV